MLIISKCTIVPNHFNAIQNNILFFSTLTLFFRCFKSSLKRIIKIAYQFIMLMVKTGCTQHGKDSIRQLKNYVGVDQCM
jgi:hypothetical protein